MLKIEKSLLEAMFQQAAEELPNECCGILAGNKDGETISVTGIYPMENLDKSPEHFSIDPKALFNLHREFKTKGLTMLGNYHSHPSTPSRPSVEDIRLAYDPEAVYAIISLKDTEPVFKVFFVREGTYEEIPVEII